MIKNHSCNGRGESWAVYLSLWSPSKILSKICHLNLSIQLFVARRTYSSILEGILECFLLHFWITLLQRSREWMEKSNFPLRFFFRLIPLVLCLLNIRGRSWSYMWTYIQTYLSGSSFFPVTKSPYSFITYYVLSNCCPLQVRHSLLRSLGLLGHSLGLSQHKSNFFHESSPGGLHPESSCFFTYLYL